MESLNPYSKVHEESQEKSLIKAHQPEKNKRRIIIIASTLILACIVISTAIGVCVAKSHKTQSQVASSSMTDIKSICQVTLYPDSCYYSLAPLVKSGNSQPQNIFKLSIQVAMEAIVNASKAFASNGTLIETLNTTNQSTLAALETCNEQLSLVLSHLNSSLSLSGLSLIGAFDDVRTWLSTAGTYHQTCIDGFETDPSLNALVVQTLRNSTEFTSNSLAILTWIENSLSSIGSIDKNNRRRLLMSLSDEERRLLGVGNSNVSVVADAIVAQDGSGKYMTIGSALNDVPSFSKKRYVIYVKRGVYVENVKVDATKWNVMVIGDGMNETLVSGKLNFVDGTPTFNTATFAVFGQGFMARDIGFLNTAGPIKQQAVALLSASDLSVFFRCRIDAFQDTLYSHSNRQFYRDCHIYGTVDFIFGNSAVVFQNCTIMARRPLSGQQNTVTAQGKTDPNMNTGICIQNCALSPFESLSGVASYLGRPWKNYSTTVFMESSMAGGFLDPKGWLPWFGFTDAPSTIFYAEYKNTGSGSGTKGRVKWTGLKLGLTSKQVVKFSVGAFIGGDQWLPATNVTYKSGL